MLTSLLARMKEKKPEDNVVSITSAKKSETAEEFVKTAEAKEFVQKWTKKRDKQGRRIYTRRGITDLLSTIHPLPGLKSNKDVTKTAERLLLGLRGMDGLQGFLAGWKAKTEGVMKGAKSILKKAA